MNLVEMLEPTEGEDCQWLGVYVTRWQREWGEPSVMFRDVDAADIAKHPEVKALVDAARELLIVARIDYAPENGGGDWSLMDWLKEEPTVAVLDDALAAFKVPE